MFDELRPAEGESERERMLRLIVDHVLEHGIVDLTLRSLGRAVGTNNRMLLYYFTSKEQLIATALQAATERYAGFAGALDSLDRTDLPLDERLTACWAGIGAPANMPIIRLFFQVFGVAAHTPGRYDAFLAAVGHQWVDRIAGVLRREGLDAVDAAALAREVVAVWRGLQFDLVSTGDVAAIAAGYTRTAAAVAARARALSPAR
jgi:AcrR family transcriptional regulator